jgi:DNA-binding XRE family transcriptional regulator
MEAIEVTGLDLRMRRVKLGLRQFHVAAELLIPQTTLCAIENGKKPISDEQAEEILAAMKRLAVTRSNDVRAS